MKSKKREILPMKTSMQRIDTEYELPNVERNTSRNWNKLINSREFWTFWIYRIGETKNFFGNPSSYLFKFENWMKWQIFVVFFKICELGCHFYKNYLTGRKVQMKSTRTDIKCKTEKFWYRIIETYKNFPYEKGSNSRVNLIHLDLQYHDST